MQLMLNMEDMYTIYRIGAHKSTRVIAKKDCFIKPELYSSFLVSFYYRGLSYSTNHTPTVSSNPHLHASLLTPLY